ncbi:SGNH hydrolase [Aspergillus karnatakaensis]|uniref:SGNH/GDSL hydrolase family protein n=1 Tax=Aspergillus karnatakaensis TaxID=1810916 RepID=UPI003CCDF984
MRLPLVAFVLFLGDTLAGSSTSWGPENWKALVTFGNSYTDDSRLDYFIDHNGTAPPVAWEQPVTGNNRYTGGYTWGHFAERAANLTRFNYALSGAVCSNEIIVRDYPPIHGILPSVLEYELPAYLADSEYVGPDGKKFMDIEADETVYSIWIGTNDLGFDAFLGDAQVRGTTIPDYVDCVYKVLDGVYDNGGRYFVIMNLVPLQLSPTYATLENGGVSGSPGHPVIGLNVTEKSYRMWEAVATVNEIYRYRTPFEAVIADRYPGAQLAVMDTYGLISEIYNNPIGYLDAPANVTGFLNHCTEGGVSCQQRPNAGSYLWFDALHPSERVHEILAKEFVSVVDGTSRWAIYY